MKWRLRDVQVVFLLPAFDLGCSARGSGIEGVGEGGGGTVDPDVLSCAFRRR